MNYWWSAASIMAVLGAMAVLSLRRLNRRTAPRFRAALVDASVSAGLMMVAAVPLVIPVLMLRDPMAEFAPIRLTVPLLLAAIPATLYLVVRDGLPGRHLRGRSPGKRSNHLRVERSDARRMNVRWSLRRNSTLLVVPLLVLPWTAPVAAAVLLVEILLAWRDPRGMRLGDRLAGTQVLYRRHHRRRDGASEIDRESTEERVGIAS